MTNIKIACLGDSITEGVGVIEGERYLDYLQNLFGVKVFGYGRNGAQYLHLLEQAQQLWTEHQDSIDYIIVFAGTNDFYRNIPIGEWFIEREKEVLNDKTDQKSLSKRRVREIVFNTNTFKGRINILLSFLKEKYATKEIVLLTPLHRAYASFGLQNIQYDELHSNDIGLFFEEYVKAVREAADIWAVRLIDSYRDSGLFPLSDLSAKEYFVNVTTDRLHLNKEGHYRLAKLIISQLYL